MLHTCPERITANHPQEDDRRLMSSDELETHLLLNTQLTWEAAVMAERKGPSTPKGEKKVARLRVRRNGTASALSSMPLFA